MRPSLESLIEKTIILKYELPNNGIPKTIYSTRNDTCYALADNSNCSCIVEIIYNSIIDYAFNEYELEGTDLNTLHAKALKAKIRYNENADDSTKVKYGFLGEVMLNSILMVMYKTQLLIARGYFYNPLEKSETKGYDSYRLIEYSGTTELWFGEVKFHMDADKAIDSVMSNIEKALSDSYLETNVLAISNHRRNLNAPQSKIVRIIEEWEANPQISIIDEIQKHRMKFVYPILLLYDSGEHSYDNNISRVPRYILQKHQGKQFNIKIPYELFFILVPLRQVAEIKKEVIEWIDSKKPLLS